MNYIYDILLNFTDSKRVYDFFEWEQNDQILNFKKVPIFRVSNEALHDIYHYKVKFPKEFLKKIENVSNTYKRSKKNFKYVAIFSDGAKAIGISFNSNGITDYKSSLLLEEEEEANFIAEKSTTEEFSYRKLSLEEQEEFLTRKELEEKDFLVKEIKKLYKNSDVEKMKYMYIEYFDKKEENIEQIYKGLLDSLDHIDSRHEKLYQLLKLSYKK